MYEASPTTSTRITDLIDAWSNHRPGAADALAESVYQELKQIAHHVLRKEVRAGLEPTELVHEAWLRMGKGKGSFPSRQHFYAFAALQMQRLLIDLARASGAAARGGDPITVSLRLADPAPQPADMLSLAEALSRLDRIDQRKSQAFALTELGGFSHHEVAEMLAVSLATVERDLRFARTWLAARMA